MNNNFSDRIDQPEDRELDLNVSKKKCETSFSGVSTSNTSRPGEFFKNLFWRDQKPLRTNEKVEENLQDKSMTQGQVDCVAQDNFSKQNTYKIIDRVDIQEHNEVDLTSEMSFELHTSNTGRTRGFSSATSSFEDQKSKESNFGLTVEELAPNDEQKNQETCLQRNNFNKLDTKEPENDARMKSPQREKRAINPLTFLKEELLKVFKEKETDLEAEDNLLIPTQDDSNINEDAVNSSSSKDMSSKTSWRAEENIDNCQEVKNMLSEEEELNYAFRGNFEEQNKEKMNAEKVNHVMNCKDQPEGRGLGLNVLKEKPVTSVCKMQQSDEMMCTFNPSRPGGFFKNLFRRDQKTLKTSEKEENPEIIITVSEKKDKQVDSGARGILSEQNEDKNTRDGRNQPEKNENELMSEDQRERTCFSESTHSQDVTYKSKASGPTGFSATGVRDQKPRKAKSAQIAEEPSQENYQRQSETCLQEDGLGHADVDTNDLLKENQREKIFSILTLNKEDHPLGQTENLPTVRNVSPLEEGSSLFKDFNTSQTSEKSNNVDCQNVVRTEDSSKQTDMKDERSDDPFTNLFGKIQMLMKTSEKIIDNREGALLGKKEENVENLNDGTIIDKLANSELQSKAPEKKSETHFLEKQQSDESMCTSNTSKSEGIFQKLFRRDPNPLRCSEKLQDTQEVKHMQSEEQLHCGFMENLTDQNKPDNIKDERNINVFEKQQSQRTCTIKTGQLKGCSNPKTGFGAQKLNEVQSCQIAEEPSQEKEKHLQDDGLTHKCEQNNNKVDKDVEFLKTNQIEKRAVGPLTLLKEDLSQFKEDLLNVFRIGVSKGKDIKPDFSQSKFLKVEDATELFRREELPGVEVSGNISEQHKETPAAEDKKDQPVDSEMDLNYSEEKSEKGFHEGQPSEETLLLLHAGGDTATEGLANMDEEDGASETLSLEISLIRLSCASKDSMRGQPGGDLWSPKNFATYLTFDPNTANSELRLMEGNRKAARYWLDHGYLDHPERFQRCPQVLCREGLLDSVYWEVEWSGGADVGVTYNSISRDGDASSCLLGHNERSWSLECSEGSYTPCYNKRRFKASSPEPFTHRVGVHLDWSAGTLSFYCVSQDTMAHLHTFTSTFTEPLYAGFWIWAYRGSVSLRQVELDWERLQ